jgi:hypothetical protein
VFERVRLENEWRSDAGNSEEGTVTPQPVESGTVRAFGHHPARMGSVIACRPHDRSQIEERQKDQGKRPGLWLLSKLNDRRLVSAAWLVPSAFVEFRNQTAINRMNRVKEPAGGRSDNFSC